MDTRPRRLYEAAYVGDVSSLNKLLDEDKLLLHTVVTTTEANDNPLHVAAFRGHASFVRKILQQKPQLTHELNAQGMSPLHLAVAEGHIPVVAELLQDDAGSCFLQEYKHGYLPVHIAVTKGRYNLVTLLLEKAKDSLNIVTNSSETLLHLAVKANCSEMVEHLTARGVTKLVLNAKDTNGNTSLHLACEGRQQKVIEHLLSQPNIDLNAQNSAFLTPMDVLLVTNHEMQDIQYLAEILRAAGGKTAKELGPSTIINLGSTDAHNTSWWITGRETEDTYDSIGNLMVVATLVAAATFTAALNPPGGSIQMSFEDKDRANPSYFSNWEHVKTLYPAGSPVYLWILHDFFYYDCLALLLSVSVILLSLSGITRYKLVKKCLILVLWLSIYFMATAFFSALKILFYTKEDDSQFKWLHKVDFWWDNLFTFAIGELIMVHAFSYAMKKRDRLRYPFKIIYLIHAWLMDHLPSVLFISIGVLEGLLAGIFVGWLTRKLLNLMDPVRV